MSTKLTNKMDRFFKNDNPKAHLKIDQLRGAWVAQLVKRPSSAQGMNLQSVSSSPASGFVLSFQSLEPALDSVSSPFSALCPLTLSLSLSLSVSQTMNKC